ncbi:hypothetical protein DFH09DRAFT_1312076 [Mycena vulgaris]|nr:hypothetical protein DFH09DRAFT_1312076 [Mycena vulgaris]
MHPALRLENISNIPTVSLRRAATLAANDSLEHVRKVKFAVMNDPSPQSILLLPVFYANLDPANIPHIPELEERILWPEVRAAIGRATLSLDALDLLNDTPPEVYPSLWPRVWKWSEFLDTYPHCDPFLPADEYEEMSFHTFYYIARLHLHAETARLIDATPRLRVFIAKIWGMLVKTKGPAFEDVCRFIGRSEGVLAPEHMDEFIEGSGGTVSDLALLVVTHITSTSAELGPEVSQLELFCITSALHFVVGRPFDIRYRDFYRALVAHGTVSAVIRIVNALEKVTIEGVDNLLQACFVLLAWTFHAGDKLPWIAEALESGLVRAITSYIAYHSTPGPATRTCLRFLAMALPQSLAYHSFLPTIVGSLMEVEHLVFRQRFIDSEIFDQWGAFKALIQHRRRMFEWFNSDEFQSYRACDNLKCGMIHVKANFMRCSGCLIMYYCSKNCQRLDWQEGGHRDTCVHHRKLRSPGPHQLNIRDRSFIRALVDDDYAALRQAIFHNQLAFVCANPTEQFYVVFDYSGGPPSIEVRSTSDNPGYSVQQWEDYLSRQIASAGQMELHLMIVEERDHPRMLPMRSDSSRIHDELRRMASSVDPGEIAHCMALQRCSCSLKSEIERLIKEQDEYVTYTH